jgi:hypothetical protein
MPHPPSAGRSILSSANRISLSFLFFLEVRAGVGRTYIKGQPIRRRRKGNLTSLGEIKHISRFRQHRLARLVGDLKLAFQDDLHLVVGVLVDERGALFETVEATRNRLVGVVLVAVVCVEIITKKLELKCLADILLFTFFYRVRWIILLSGEANENIP